jgi:hypothetical protein
MYGEMSGRPDGTQKVFQPVAHVKREPDGLFAGPDALRDRGTPEKLSRQRELKLHVEDPRT